MSYRSKRTRSQNNTGSNKYHATSRSESHVPNPPKQHQYPSHGFTHCAYGQARILPCGSRVPHIPCHLCTCCGVPACFVSVPTGTPLAAKRWALCVMLTHGFLRSRRPNSVSRVFTMSAGDRVPWPSAALFIVRICVVQQLEMESAASQPSVKQDTMSTDQSLPDG